MSMRQYVLHGSGHVVPQREVELSSIAGPAAGDIEFAEVIAEFFDAR
jgi:poly(3-hydroxybutyrate) depolymerase